MTCVGVGNMRKQQNSLTEKYYGSFSRPMSLSACAAPCSICVNGGLYVQHVNVKMLPVKMINKCYERFYLLARVYYSLRLRPGCGRLLFLTLHTGLLILLAALVPLRGRPFGALTLLASEQSRDANFASDSPVA
jgi:hypothetical protein